MWLRIIKKLWKQSKEKILHANTSISTNIYQWEGKEKNGKKA